MYSHIYRHFQKTFGQVLAANTNRPTAPLLPRTVHLKALEEEEYDVLIIGGGATGSGCALDSVSRGTTHDSLEIT